MSWLIMCQQLFQKLKNLMRPYSVTFESPLELSAQGETVCNKTAEMCLCSHSYMQINMHKQTLTCMI